MISTERTGEIITFYSYKGGTGRTMALSNVACTLAERESKDKILMIDWDLEAPGLHRFFHDKYIKLPLHEFDEKPGIIDLFLKLDAATPKSIPASQEAEKSAYDALNIINLDDFTVKTDINNLYLLKAGRFDANYSNKVNSFDWESLYNRSPLMIRLFAELLEEQYRYVLIDSRTGYTDISGICTMLMPEKLVVVFTPNRQSYTGIKELVKKATEYRRQSDDLRPLLVFPLPSRIEPSLEDLRRDWRSGNPDKNIEGFQPMFENLFKETYELEECNLKNYFNEVQILQNPYYAYGEEIAIKLKVIQDKISMSESYVTFTEWLVNSAAPWQRSKDTDYVPIVDKYLNFELEISPGIGQKYPIKVHSPAGEADEIMHFPYDDLALDNNLLALQKALLSSGGKSRQILTEEDKTVREFGQKLFDTLLNDKLRSLYDVSLSEAANRGKGLRLKLRIKPPELAALPWEFLYDSRQADYISLSNKTPLIRYIELPQPIKPLTIEPPLHILGMIASPSDLPMLDVQREKQRVEEAIKSLRERDLVDITWLSGKSWVDLQQAMRTGTWHIFHFIGHGGFDLNTDQGFIALTDEDGQTFRLSATHLGRFLAGHSQMRLVLLNSGEGAHDSKHDVFSNIASTLVRRGIPTVLAMQYKITDKAAIEFIRAFYLALSDGMPVDVAVAEARIAISVALTNTIEWGMPVLYTRSPDGVLFNIMKKSKIYHQNLG